jgi:arsenate reductase
MALTLWHNPRCSKSRAALALLAERGIEPEIRLYLKTPPTVPEVLALADRLGRPLREILRRKEPPYRALNLAVADDVTLAAAVAENPILLERPILDTGTRAILGRPPESILVLL